MLTEACNWVRWPPPAGPTLLGGFPSTVEAQALYVLESQGLGGYFIECFWIITVLKTFHYREIPDMEN